MSKGNSFIKGAALLTITMFISKILGFAYIIPFTRMVGTEGYILFEYAYKPYVIMLSIATMGIPMAVSKFVSKYNELGDFETGRRLFRSGTVILTITGFVWAAVLFLLAPTISNLLIDESQPSGNSLSDVVYVIRMVSAALIVVPVMAMIRGYFQGHQLMNPTAVSQVVEQLIRIILILAGSFLVIQYGSGKISDAVGISTFAAFVGAMASMLVLFWYWKIYKNTLQVENTIDVTRKKPSLFEIYKELFYYSIPFVIVSLAIPIYQNIDMFSINPTLIASGMTQVDAEYVNGIVAIVQKVVTIPIIFANAFALTLVPAITKSYISKNQIELHSQISKTLQVILYFTLPCAVVFFVFPQETYGVLLGTENAVYGGVITRAYALISLFFSIFLVTTAILQGLNKQYLAVLGLILGVAVKLVLTVPMLSIYGGEGTAYSTMIGFSISIVVNLVAIKKSAKFRFSEILKQALSVLLTSLCLLVALYFLKAIVGQLVSSDISDYLRSFLVLGISGTIGVLVYLGISYRTGLLQTVFGSKFKKRG